MWKNVKFIVLEMKERMTEGRPGHHAYSGLSNGYSLGRIHCLKNVYVPPSRELCARISSVISTTSAYSCAAVVAAALGVASGAPLSCIAGHRDSTSEGRAPL